MNNMKNMNNYEKRVKEIQDQFNPLSKETVKKIVEKSSACSDFVFDQGLDNLRNRLSAEEYKNFCDGLI